MSLSRVTDDKGPDSMNKKKLKMAKLIKSSLHVTNNRRGQIRLGDS